MRQGLKNIEAMVSDNNVIILKKGQSHILYDASLIEHPDEQLFANNRVTDIKQGQKYAGQSTGIGRAPVVFFQHQNLSLVLKHYYRGGLVAKISRDWYLGFKLENTRAYREWCLLRTMRNLKLPVPVPVAARVIKKAVIYRADLITVEIEHAETLADYIMKQVVSDELWKDIGRCLKRFHGHNIFHADLNARNILLQMSGELDTGDLAFEVFLIDFDRGDIRPESDVWKTENLARLKRSLDKFKRNQEKFNFDESDWRCLLAGYER